MKNNEFVKERVMPIVVLVTICLVITAALAYTNSITKPIIAENAIKAANEARVTLLAEADGFTAFDGDLISYEEGAVAVTECYIADNGAGMVITVSTKSFGGAMIEMIGLDAEGKITGVKVTSHADTPGLGTKAHDEVNHLPQYVGVSELTSPSAKAEASIDHIAGATVTSDAVHYGVKAALEQYKIAGGAN